MTELRFEWNHAKSNSNAKKHGIDFEEAKSVFYDDDALLIKDSVHSVQEDRFLLLGMSARLRIILVCHCVREWETPFELFWHGKLTGMSKANTWQD